MNENDYSTLYVSTQGDDSWSGTLAEPDPRAIDGPLATIARARDLVREMKLAGNLSGAVTVHIRGGVYPVSEPLLFVPEDSAPITYRAYTGEQPIIDGGQRIDGWQIMEDDPRRLWVTDLPEVEAGTWYFHQLWVNGERRRRPRLPKEGFYWMEDVHGTTFSSDLFAGTDTFRCASGDVQSWRNLTDVQVLVPHFWVEERMPIASFDEKSRTVKSTHRSVFSLKDDVAARYARYCVENVFEALSEPGEWYLDRLTGKLYYLPMQGETPETAQVYAPRTEYLLKLIGMPDEERYVEFLRFEGIEFRHADWRQSTGRSKLFSDSDDLAMGREPETRIASAPQAACDVPGTIYLEGARYCAIENCRISRLGGYGVELGDGCTGIRVANNNIFDMGAGGVKLTGSDAGGPVSRRTSNNQITDNHIHAGGRVFPSAVGILSAHSFGNYISHNHIHHLYYSGVSCGWVWGYADNISKNNHIEKNYIHHIGHGLLSDMGGIYTLGVQPGTVLRGNLIHDVEKHNYGGWGIYLDEGSSHILVEGNICYNTSSQGFNQHYGRENIVRNNIFAFGREGQVSLSRAESHNSFTFENNILIADGQPMFVAGYAGDLDKRAFRSDLNLLWDRASASPISGNGKRDDVANWTLSRVFIMQEWREFGYDRHSLISDPLCRDLSKPDFNLSAGSPAFELGFRSMDISDIGPRSKD